jgi:hypothetical protein
LDAEWILDTFDSLGDPYSLTSARLWSLVYGIVGGLAVGIVTGGAIALLLTQQTLSEQWSEHRTIAAPTTD